MSYKLYLGIDNGREGFILPENPSDISVNSPGNNKGFEVINLGEITKLQRPKPKEISFKSCFPLHINPYINTAKLLSPSYYISKIEEWRLFRKYIRFIFTGGPIEINDLFSIEDFSYSEVGGAVGDIEFEIKLKKYIPYAPKKVVIEKTIAVAETKVMLQSSPQRPVDNPTPKKHVVRPGDTLWGLAKKYLGNGNRYPEIAKLNNIKNPNLIYDGQTIILP